MSAQNIYTNLDLTVGEGNKQRWNQAAHRRHGFHNAHRLMRRMLMLRSRHVLGLVEDFQDVAGKVDGLTDLLGNPAFSALTCLQGNRVVFERSAADFSPFHPHSIQSVTKLHVHLIVGRLIREGRLDLGKPVRHYLPDIGSGYADAPVQAVLDMAVVNDFSEDYLDPLADCYAEEMALGWRLPEEGVAEPTLAEFARGITGYDPQAQIDVTQYKSANTDVLTLICAALLPHPLSVEMEAICDAVGYEGAFHVTLSSELLPALSGGGCLSARDLARFGLLFGRQGRDIHGAQFANEAFLGTSLARDTQPLRPPRDWLRYSNHMMTDGRFLGHAGYGGQFLMVDIENNTSCAFLSVLENEAGYDDAYMAAVVESLKELCLALAD